MVEQILLAACQTIKPSSELQCMHLHNLTEHLHTIKIYGIRSVIKLNFIISSVRSKVPENIALIKY